jgi:hypothetical protein
VRLLIVDDEHARVGDEARDRDEVGIGELDLPAEQLVDFGEPRNRYHMNEQRVAVGPGAGGNLGADLAGST